MAQFWLPISDMYRGINREVGFTLIEIMVNVAIVSILAAIAVMSYQEYRVRAFDTATKSDLRNAIIALEAYFTKQDTFPSTSSGLLASGLNLSTDVSFTDYKKETLADGSSTVHMVAKHAASPNGWHGSYPEDGNEIELEGKPLKKRGKRLGQNK